jgi:hypothetical protein
MSDEKDFGRLMEIGSRSRNDTCLPKGTVIYAADKPYCEVFEHFSEVARASSISMTIERELTPSEWLHREQEKHWNIY